MDSSFYTGFNNDSIKLPKGTPVCISGTKGGYARASSSSPSTSAFGILSQDGAIGLPSIVQLSGDIALPDWTMITGNSFLTPGAVYWIYSTPRKLTTVQPINDPVQQFVGVAISPTILNITHMSANVVTSFADGPNLDAYSRLRISDPKTLFDISAQYGTHPLRMESGNTSDGVLPAWSSSTRLITLQINAGVTGGSSYLQSFTYIPYQTSKSQMIWIAGLVGAATAGAVKRFGYGDANNGFFFEQNGTSGLQFNRRTAVSGSAVDNPVTQANWNLDKLDGSGRSGLTLDITKVFVLIIDCQSFGRVRVGFDIGGQIIYAHQFLASNVLSASPIQTMTLPVLIEIQAAAGLGGAATAYLKEASVICEGGATADLGRDFSVQGTVTAGNGTRTHILSLQPQTTFKGVANRGFFLLDEVDIIVTGNNPIYWELVVGAAFTGALSYSAVNANYSFTNFATGGTFANLTNGIVIESGYVSSTTQNRGQISEDLSMSYPISLDKSGAVRALGTLSLLVTGIGATSATQAAFTWREIR